MKTKISVAFGLLAMVIAGTIGLTMHPVQILAQQECVYNGKAYKDGTVRPDGAVCKDGKWQ